MTQPPSTKARGRSCRSCGQWISAELIAEKAKLKGQRVSAALKENWRLGNPVGRPRERDDKLIWSLREMGLSMREIAHRAKCSLAKVQRSIAIMAASND